MLESWNPLFFVKETSIPYLYVHNGSKKCLALKKAPVDPDSTHPYLILVCLAYLEIFLSA